MLQRSRTIAGPSAVPGFTLVELMITVAVLAVIAAMAMPSFTNLVRSNRLTASANEMVALLQTARTAAVSNRASSSVCPSTDGASCAAALGNHWIALMTKNGVDTVLREATLPPSIVVKASANLAGGGNKFTFTPIGFSAVGAKASGSLGLCVQNLSGDNGIDVSASAGRVSTLPRAATAACTGPGDN
ncbi:prepilin [Pseudoxanthomonas yeongjuensis]|jgi:type IV fimbrial biogenesis protein FimT|uniref:GspH/FimT family pseudopilin n=1 Tax=Pseudoxanthomonas yeongjuensis TaxID=377616 RepID=UPI001390969E|nr:GspH/FimT family pseudopilin [Pseudoxanthomonas yeongjuensis]KAF1718413.1 prepilin [Pseudoxanthomonas yeongjuensis]